MGAKPNVRVCAHRRSSMTQFGRKQNDRFGESRLKKRTGSNRPVPAVQTVISTSRKRPFVGGPPTSARGGEPTLGVCPKTDMQLGTHPGHVEALESVRAGDSPLLQSPP